MIQRIKKALKVVILLVLFVLIVYFSFRNSLLEWGIAKGEGVISEKTGAALTIRSGRFTGFSTISLEDILLVPVSGDTIIKADSVRFTLSGWKLLTGTIRINDLFSSNVVINLSCHDSICNYSSLINHEKVSAGQTGTNYSVLFRRMLDRLFNLAPQSASLHNISLLYRNDSIYRKLTILEFKSNEDSLAGIAVEDRNNEKWLCNGKFSQSKHALNLNVYPADGSNASLPLTKEIFGLTVRFDTVNIALNSYNWHSDNFSTEGKFSVKSLVVFHQRIAEDTVKIPSASFNFIFHAGKKYLEVDSTSEAMISNILIHPYLWYSTDSSKIYALKIKTEKLAANDFFASLPEGMFDEVRDLGADGTLSYSLDFRLDSGKPDSLIFESGLRKEKFRLKKFGSANILKMNGEFMQSVYEHDKLVRIFPVGPSNEYYTPLDKISPEFINSVLTSEDGSFLFHNGFNEDAFRKSIVANFKAGKFVRGGSTISMQLVKNVFLTRKKTVARKAEEALLVWLIENNRLYTKERMLEVYLNIIELGPDVYGIGEASEFYFNKKPSEINLPEGIFLASLLPRPKWFKYSFDAEGNLKPYLADYYRIVSDFMLRKNLITAEEHDQLLPHVVLSGPARDMIILKDTVPEEGEIPLMQGN